jgi:hypothetical protein
MFAAQSGFGEATSLFRERIRVIWPGTDSGDRSVRISIFGIGWSCESSSHPESPLTRRNLLRLDPIALA